MSTAQDTGRVYALLADGTTVEIRPATPADFDAVKAMHEAMSPDNIYLRFFSFSRLSAETEADGSAGRARRAGWRCSRWRTARWPASPATPNEEGPRPGRGRVRGRRAHAPQGHRHPAARAPGLGRPEPPHHHVHRADTLTENTADAARVRRRRPARSSGTTTMAWLELTFPLPPDDTGTALDTYLEHGSPARAQRRRRQPAAPVRAGVGRGDRRQPPTGDDRPGHPGQHPQRRVRGPPVHGEPAAPVRSTACSCAADGADLPEPPDLAVIAVPARPSSASPKTADSSACGRSP